MALLQRQTSTHWRIKAGITAAGIVAGVIFGVVLTVLGKIVAGAPPATVANYAWNAGVFGVLAGVVSPIVTWSALRRVPLWRTVAEPLTFATVGGAAAVLVASPMLLLTLPPAGLIAGFVLLNRRYPQEAGSDPALSGSAPPRQISKR